METGPPSDSEGVSELIRVLPHISGDVLLQIEANIERLQTALILAWKGMYESLFNNNNNTGMYNIVWGK